jgi:ABC-type proline/glycine betaine transport system permease subunit
MTAVVGVVAMTMGRACAGLAILVKTVPGEIVRMTVRGEDSVISGVANANACSDLLARTAHKLLVQLPMESVQIVQGLTQFVR